MKTIVQRNCKTKKIVSIIAAYQLSPLWNIHEYQFEKYYAGREKLFIH